MLAIAGTVPDPDFPLLSGPAKLEHGRLVLGKAKIPVNRGTPALIAASIAACEFLGSGLPLAILAGDTGLGHGSRKLYYYLAKDYDYSSVTCMAFHYLQPDVDWHNQVLFRIQELDPRPKLIADAGFMYAAKMSGMAGEYDLFTPDVGELAFLADEQAPHPFYTRGFILQDDNKAPEYIARAYEHQNAAKNLLVKGRRDLVADQNGISASVDKPCAPAMEAIGGTGDTITGMAAALVAAGLDMGKACLAAAQANRIAAQMADPDPATQIGEIIPHLPKALEQALAGEEK